MLLKRSISLFLAMILITQPITVLGSENANSSDVLLSVDAQVFSAVVPTQLPVWMSASGVITVAEDVNITNTSKGPIRVDNIELANVKADWELVNFDSDFSSFKVGSKKLAMSFNGDKSLISGDIPLGASNLTPIDGLTSMSLNYDAKIPAQSTGLVDEIPANVVFTLKWHEVGSADIEENNPNIYEFVPADTKVLTINFKGITADTDSVTWSSSNEAVATVADHVSKGRARPIDGSKQCIVTAVGSGKATITGVLGDGTANSFEVVVADRAITSLEVTKTPDKLAYIEGENFNAAGMIVTVNYNNGTNVDISDYIIVDGNNLVIGQDLVVISYNGKTTNQPISVVEKNLTDIAITTPPTKTSYVEGNDFDATGMIVTAYYDNGTNKVVSPTLSKDVNLTVGQIDVGVSYSGKTVSQNIIVNAKTIANIVITRPPTKTSYIEGNNFDASGMTVTANYDNGTSAVITPIISRHINLATGQTSVDVSFGGKTVTQTITVATKTLTSIDITNPPSKTAYIEANNFDKTGMVVKAIYNNGTSNNIGDYTVVGGTNLAIGKTSVDISYNGKLTSQAITVAAKTLTSIAITTPPTKTSYVEGNDFDMTGMVVTAYYNNGTNKVISPILSQNTNLTRGQTSVHVSFGGKTINQSISVNAKTLANIVITSPPTKISYIEGNSFDSTGMIVTANYDNGTSAIIAPTLSRNTNLTTGQTSVDVSFGGKTITQTITVSAKTLTSIAITIPPTKTAYIEGNSFDKVGMVVTAYYNNGTSNAASPTFGRHTNMAVGQTSVDINFGGQTITQAITVIAKTLTSIAITTPPNKTTYIEGNTFSSTGMIVTATYNNGTSSIVTPTFGRHTKLTVGQASVDVSFDGKTITQAITVSAKMLTNIAITAQPTKKAYIEANNFDSTGMVVTATYNNGTTEVITPTFGRHTNLTTGQTSVDVSFGGKTVTQAITVAAKTLTSIAITTQPTKKAYIEANNFDSAGMVVTATYNNGTTSIVIPTFGRNTNLVTGQTSVDVSFNGKTVTQAITVVAKSLTSIAITTQPNKKSYIEANNFDSTGMIVTATYNNGTTGIVVPTFAKHTNLTVGQTTVDVSFGGKTVTQAITVSAKSLTSIAITTAPSQTSYVEANNFNSSGMVVTAYYNNGTSNIISPTLSRNTNLTTGQTSVDISFGGKAVTQAITVAAKSLVSIAITTPPSKTIYAHWDNFDRAGMIVTASYNNGTTEDVTNYTVSDGTNMIGNKTSVTINYNGKTTTQAIIVSDIAVGTKHTEGNYEYSYGQGLDYSGRWKTASGQEGWGVRAIDNTQTNYANPLTTIQGRPVTNMASLFAKSPATTLNLIDWDTSMVTNMNNMFHGAKATTLNLSSFDTSNVTNMNNMFYDSQATSLDLNSFDTSKVTDMGGMFSKSKATSLDLSSLDTSNVTNMNVMFNRSEATSINGLSSFDTSNVTNMNNMFNYSQATSLDLSSFDTSKVTDMNSMFEYSQATSINGLSSFNTSKVTNMSEMFYATKATSLDLGSFNTSNVTTMYRMFNGSQATSLDLSSFDTSKVTNMNSMFAYSQATSLDLSNFDTSNVNDMSSMFSSSNATILDVSSFDTSKVRDMSNMFNNSQATSLGLSSFNTSNVTNMSQMFYHSKATSLDLSSFNTSKVTDMSGMFYYSQATSLDLSSFDTSKVRDMSNMFNNSQATSLDLSSFDTSKVTDMSGMFDSSQVKNLAARTQADADKYKASSYFPTGITVTVKT